MNGNGQAQEKVRWEFGNKMETLTHALLFHPSVSLSPLTLPVVAVDLLCKIVNDLTCRHASTARA